VEIGTAVDPCAGSRALTSGVRGLGVADCGVDCGVVGKKQRHTVLESDAPSSEFQFTVQSWNPSFSFTIQV
jgi:hypothetical protein